MFFRREKPRDPSFAERLESLRRFGFNVTEEGSSRAKVTKYGCAAVIEDAPKRPLVHRAGVIMGGEIGLLVDAGYQKYFRTPKDKRLPALANHLKSLHDFQEDLKEALDITSLYNEGLGTVNDEHMYDRVQGRDAGVTRPWRVRL